MIFFSCRADVGFADMFMIPNRRKIIDYTDAYEYEYVCFMVRTRKQVVVVYLVDRSEDGQIFHTPECPIYVASKQCLT